MADYEPLKPGIVPASPATTSSSEFKKDAKDGFIQSETEIKQIEPAVLGRWSLSRLTLFILKALLTLAPLCFLVLAILALCLHNKPVTGLYATLQKVMPLVPTIFPILFAALMGKFFKTWALFRAERGARLGTVERLSGCQSLFSAMELQFKTAKWDLCGLSILIVWLLSPLGGQAGARLLDCTAKIVEFDSTIAYFPYLADLGDYSPGTQDNYLVLWSSAITTADRYETVPMDIWGNVKMPSINFLRDKLDGGNGESWTSTNRSSLPYNVTYSSLVGLPMTGLPSIGNTTHVIRAWQWNITCNKVETVKAIDVFEFSPRNFTINPDDGAVGSSVDFMMYTGTANNLKDAKIYCSANLETVEGQVECVNSEASTCSVTHMRLAPGSLRVGDPMLSINEYLNETIYDIRSTTPDPANMDNTPFMSFLTDGFADFFDTMPLDLLGIRLEQAINAMWLCRYGHDYIQRLPVNSILSSFTKDNLTALQVPQVREQSGMDFNRTLASGTKSVGDVYICRITFAVLLCCISALLFAASVATITLDGMILAPDILGSVSPLLRDDFAPATGSHLDGKERTRHHYNQRVRIGDVRSGETVGRVAFVTDESVDRVAKLQRGRLYE